MCKFALNVDAIEAENPRRASRADIFYRIEQGVLTAVQAHCVDLGCKGGKALVRVQISA